MRIALVYDAIYPYIKGGAERIFAEVGQRLAARHEVHLFGMKLWDGPAVKQIGERLWLHGACPARPLYRHGRRSLPAALELAARLPGALWRAGRFDVIDIMSIPYFPLLGARLAGALRGTPVVVTWLEYWREYWPQYLPHGATLARLVEWGATRLSPHVIAISEHTRQGMIRAGVAPGRIDLVTPGIDWERLHALEPAAAGADILFTGRLVRDKRVDLVLETLARLRQRRPQTRAIIVGEGPERAALEAQAARLGLTGHVEFAGYLRAAEDVYRLMKACRLFLFPSEREGFGIVVLEAAACGLPVVAVEAPNNAAATLVREGAFGRLAPPDPAALASQTLALLEDEPQRAALAAHGTAWSQAFAWEAIAARTEAVLEKIRKRPTSQ